MPQATSTYSGDPDGVLSATRMATILQNIEAPVSEIIARSMITSSFNGNDRFDWTPTTGLRVSIPDRHSFVKFEREPGAELRNRLFPFPPVRGNNHRSAPRQKEYPERSLAWWFAQLVHWGLPITVDREEAKDSFRNAIREDRLEVPTRLKDLASRLRRTYVMQPTDQLGVVETDEIVFEQNSWTDREDTMTGGGRNPLKVPPQPAKLMPPPPSKPLPKPSTSKSSASNDSNLVVSKTNSCIHQHDTSNAMSSSDSDDGRSPKNGHMFTPHGVKITRPAEYPGLREREAQERQKKKSLEVLGREALSNSAIEQSRSLTNHQDNHTETESEADSSDESEQDEAVVEKNREEETVVKTPPTHTVKQVKRATSAILKSEAQSSVNIWEIEDDSERESDSDSGFESVNFYTPMQFLKKRPDDIDIPDDASVVFTGYKHKPTENRRKDLGQKTFRTDGAVKKECESRCKKLKTNEPVVNHKQFKKDGGLKKTHTASGFKIKTPEAKPTEATAKKKGNHKCSTKHEQIQQVIDISTDDSASDTDASSSESEYEEFQLRTGDRIPTPLPIIQPKIAPSKADAAEVSKHSSMPGNSSGKILAKPGTTVSIRATSEPRREKLSSAKDEKRSKYNKKPKNDKSKGLSEKAKGEQREISGQQVESQSSFQPVVFDNQDSIGGELMVRDYSGCGITEMSGGLHPSDEKVSRKLAFSKEASWLTSPARSVTPEMSSNNQRMNGLQCVSDDQDLESELPSLTDLFSTPDTPEGWKIAARNINKAKHKKQADDSSDTDITVFESQESTAELPSWLQTSARNNSPELSQSKSSPTATKSKKKHSDSKQKGGRERTLSVSVAPTSRKRTRPTMIEIEAERPSALKIPRTTMPRYDPASAALGVFRVNVPVQLPGSKKSKGTEAVDAGPASKKSTLYSQVMTCPKEKAKKVQHSKVARRRAKSVGASNMRTIES